MSRKLDSCVKCGFRGHPCQLDVDHRNNDPVNLQTLCANCHRLKTQENGDWRNASHARKAIVVISTS